MRTSSDSCVATSSNPLSPKIDRAVKNDSAAHSSARSKRRREMRTRLTSSSSLSCRSRDSQIRLLPERFRLSLRLRWTPSSLPSRLESLQGIPYARHPPRGRPLRRNRVERLEQRPSLEAIRAARCSLAPPRPAPQLQHGRLRPAQTLRALPRSRPFRRRAPRLPPRHAWQGSGSRGAAL